MYYVYTHVYTTLAKRINTFKNTIHECGLQVSYSIFIMFLQVPYRVHVRKLQYIHIRLVPRDNRPIHSHRK